MQLNLKNPKSKVLVRFQAGSAHGGVHNPARSDGRVLRRDGALHPRRAVRRPPRAGVRPPRARRRRRRGRALHLPRELRHHAGELTCTDYLIISNRNELREKTLRR